MAKPERVMVKVVRIAMGKILYMAMKAFQSSWGPGMNIGLISLNWVMTSQIAISMIGTISLGSQGGDLDLTCVLLLNWGGFIVVGESITCHLPSVVGYCLGFLFSRVGCNQVRGAFVGIPELF